MSLIDANIPQGHPCSVKPQKNHTPSLVQAVAFPIRQGPHGGRSELQTSTRKACSSLQQSMELGPRDRKSCAGRMLKAKARAMSIQEDWIETGDKAQGKG